MKILILLSLLLSACIDPPPTPPPAPRPTPPPTVQRAIKRGVAFIEGQFNPEIGLLEESPEIGKGVYYLTNNNVLALHLFDVIGDKDLSQDAKLLFQLHPARTFAQQLTCQIAVFGGRGMMPIGVGE